jgi:hypothetical protein
LWTVGRVFMQDFGCRDDVRLGPANGLPPENWST